jgi:hypothetical protein
MDIGGKFLLSPTMSDSIITITEVLGRAEQGITRPFMCGGADWLTYFVKGAYAGQRSLCCEWVAGRLANALLPSMPLGIPMFTMAEVPRALVEGSARKDIKDLGEGLVFASMRIEEGQELTWSAAEGWREEIMAMLLLIDLWLQNEDRSLSALGGNPNLLVTQVPPLPDWDEEGALWKDEPRREILWAYDFNLAFDEHFDRTRFFDCHVFGGMLKQWPEGFKERMEPRLQQVLDEVRAIFAELPLEWLHVDGDETLPVQLDVEVVMSLATPLHRPSSFLDPAMNPASVCNYAMLRFLPHPETGEFVNVGVVANCLQPCFLHFLAEERMPARARLFFPIKANRCLKLRWQTCTRRWSG